MRPRLRPKHWVILCGAAVAVASCLYAFVARSGLWSAPQRPVAALAIVREDGLYGGTAFRVEAGWVTARHVLEGALLANLVDSNEDWVPVTAILADDPLHDVVIFKIEGSSSRTVETLPVARDNAAALRLGSSMRIIGPGMESANVSLERTQVMPPYGQLLVLTTAGEPGWSGGPVLTESGEVMAILRGSRGDKILASPIECALEGGSSLVSFEEWTRQPPPLPVQARTAFAHAANAESKDDIDAALAGYAEAISIEPGYVMARIRRAAVLFKLRRLADAAEELTAAMTTGADDPELHLRRMAVAREMRDCATLTDSYRSLKNIDPERSDLPLMYAQSLLKSGCINEAISVLRPFQQSPELSAEGVLLLAEALVRSGDAVAAVEALEKHNFDLPRAKFLKVIAAVIGKGGEGVAALEELMQPPTLVPRRAAFIAEQVAAIDVTPIMCTRLTEAMAPPWSSAAAAHLRGEIQKLAGDNDGAIASFKAALELDPGFWPSLGQLARVEGSLGRLETAIAYAESAVSMSGGHIDARLNLAHQLIDAGMYDRADVQSRAAIEHNDRIARSWELLGRSAWKQGRTDDAKTHFLKAESIDPSDLAVRRRYARLLMAAKDYQAAVQEFTDLKASSPDDPEAAVLLAEALLDSGDGETARAAADDAVKLMVADDVPSVRRVVRVLCNTGADDAARALLNRLGLEDRVAREILAENGCKE